MILIILNVVEDQVVEYVEAFERLLCALQYRWCLNKVALLIIIVESAEMVHVLIRQIKRGPQVQHFAL